VLFENLTVYQSNTSLSRGRLGSSWQTTTFLRHISCQLQEGTSQWGTFWWV